MASLRLCALLVALIGSAQAPALAQDDADAFRSRRMPYEAFDRLPATQVAIGKTWFDIAFAPGTLELPHRAIIDCGATSARTVAADYGRFPVDHAKEFWVPSDGAGCRP